MKQSQKIVEPGEPGCTDGTWREQFTVALMVTVLVAGLTWLVAALLVPALGVRPNSGLQFLLGYDSPDLLRPEPVEQQRYIVAVLAALVLPLVIALASSCAWLGRRAPASVAIVLQLVVVGLVVAAWFKEPVALQEFLPATRGWGLAICAVLVTGAVLARRPLIRWSGVQGRRWELVCALVALALTGSLCLAGFYFDDTLANALAITRFHFPYSYTEVYAVASGQTPLVDTTPQYTALVPYLLAPWLELGGYGIGVFTGTMVAMSTATLMLGYGALRLLAGRPLRALALYLPVAAVALVPGSQQDDQTHGLATYFAVMPLRYAGPLACLAAVAAFARFGSGRRREWIGLGLLLGFTLLNNIEFGLPAALGTLVAAVLCHIQGMPRELRLRGAVRASCWLGVGLAGAVGSVFALTVARSGEAPDFAQLVYYSRQFAAAGFFMLPISTVVGLSGIIFLTFVAAVAVGAVPVLLGNRAPDPRSRVRTAVLVFTGIFGLGAFGYYVGRSHESVLAAVFLAWMLALAALAFEGLRFMRAGRPRDEPGWLLCAFAVVVFALVGLAGMRESTYGPDQVTRIARHVRSAPVVTQPGVVRFARACIPAGSDVGLLVSYGQRVADAANIRDRFPYNDPTSVATREQMDHVFDVFARYDVRLILTGTAPPAYRIAMMQRGWQILSTAPNPLVGDQPPSAGPVLELWGPATGSGNRCPHRGASNPA